MKNQMFAIVVLASVLLAAGCNRKNLAQKITYPGNCYTTKENYSALIKVHDSKVTALCDGLARIITTVPCDSSAESYIHYRQDNSIALERSFSEEEAIIGNALTIKIKEISETSKENNIRHEMFVDSLSVLFEADGISYSVFSVMFQEINDPAGSEEYRLEWLIKKDGDVDILYSKEMNNEAKELSIDQKLHDKLFDQLLGYLTQLGCTADFLQNEQKIRKEIITKEYLCLKAQKDKFSPNVKFINQQ